MLNNSRSNRYGGLTYAGCSCHNSKQDRRKVKHSMKRREQRQWQDDTSYERSWTEALRGEVWELKHSGKFGLWVCLDPTGYGNYWRSWDGKWLLIETEDLEAVSQGTFTGVVVDARKRDVY